MYTYFKEILKADNFPSWLNLVAIILVLMTLNDELSRSEIEDLKRGYIVTLSSSALPIPFENVTDNSKNVQAMSELVRDGLVLQTAYGYELRRYDPRLKDDINFATGVVLFHHFKELKLINIPAGECDKLSLYEEEAREIVQLLENMRGGASGKEFNNYLDKHKDVFTKQFFQSWAQWNGSEYDSLTKCWPEQGLKSKG